MWLKFQEFDLPTCNLEHKVESETEKEKREKIKGKKKGKSIDEKSQRIVIKEEMMKHMPPVDPHFSRAPSLDWRDSLFICEKLIFEKSWSRHLFYFYF